MRIALLSDIHGNLVAFETVLRELAKETVDQIICLGDVGALGPQPHEVVERLRQLGCPIVLGNTDAWLLKVPVVPAEASENQRILYTINAWCAQQLSQADLRYLQTFLPVLKLPLDEERTLLGFHGSPRSFDDVIAATTGDAELEAMLAGYTASIMVGGHTHLQMIRRYRDSHIINVGSIGLPGVNAGNPALAMNRNVHWAEYGVLSIERGRLSIDLRRTPLDLDPLFAAARNSGMPHLDWWLQKWASS